jgi:hypothetical protein
MNYRAEMEKIGKVLKEFIPHLKTTIIGQQVEATNIISIMKELKKINYRLDRIRSDLKLGKDNFVEKTPREKEKIDVSNSSGTDDRCAESGE